MRQVKAKELQLGDRVIDPSRGTRSRPIVELRRLSSGRYRIEANVQGAGTHHWAPDDLVTIAD